MLGSAAAPDGERLLRSITCWRAEPPGENGHCTVTSVEKFSWPWTMRNTQSKLDCLLCNCLPYHIHTVFIFTSWWNVCDGIQRAEKQQKHHGGPWGAQLITIKLYFHWNEWYIYSKSFTVPLRFLFIKDKAIRRRGKKKNSWGIFFRNGSLLLL